MSPLLQSSSTPESSWRLCWNAATKLRQGYNTINETTSVDSVKQNNKKVEKKTRSAVNKKTQPLEQIQNALFVTPRVQSKKLQTESESANFTALSLKPELAKSRPVSSCSGATTTGEASSCQRIRCKKFVRRFRKVLGETLKFTNDRSVARTEEEVEDIYVEVSCNLILHFIVKVKQQPEVLILCFALNCEEKVTLIV